MAVESEEVCRFCLKSLANTTFEIIENIKLGMLEVLLLKLNFSVSIAPLVCAGCVENLKKAFRFKTECLATKDKINKYANESGKLKIDLKEVYLMQGHPKKRKNIRDDQKVCRFCLKLFNESLLTDVSTDSSLKDMLCKCCPELDMNIIKQIYTCAGCTEGLRITVDFITGCLETENYIRKYYEVEEIPSNEQINLNLVAKFVAILKSIDPDSDEYYDSVLQGYNGESQPSKVGPLENGDSRQFDRNGTEQMSAQNLAKSKTQRTPTKKLKKRTRPKRGNITQSDPAPPSMYSPPLLYKCPKCPFETKYNSTYHKHTLKHKSEEEHQCKDCDFKTKHIGSLKRHVTIRHAVDTVHKCQQCAFQTDTEQKLTLHMNNHPVALDTAFSCTKCPFETMSKRDLNKHDVTVHAGRRYSCETCKYKTDSWQELRSHKSAHRMVMKRRDFKCDECSFTTKYKSSLFTHELSHKSNGEAVMFRCSQCDFGTKHKVSLRTHMLKHMDPKLVTFHKCDSCGFKTRLKGNLKLHMVIHADPSEAVMYKCESCDFQTRHKMSLHTHKLRHKKRSEVVLHRCDVCEFETILKGNLKKHQMIHKDASELTWYSCHLCAFETIHRGSYKTHTTSFHPKIKKETVKESGKD